LAAFGGAAAAPGILSASELAARAAVWLGARCDRPQSLLYAEQRHSAVTFVFSRERPLPPGPSHVGACDALVTDEAGVALQVRTADCLPVALAGGGAVAMIHAGWRGLAGDILAAAMRRFAADMGVAPAAIEAVVGVGIGPCHYPVGPEVPAALSRLDAAGAAWRHDGTVDLGAFAAGRLVVLGVAPERALRLAGCTFCTPGFHSFRRDGASAGRQWSAIVRQ
jgi:hypothetical protein